MTNLGTAEATNGVTLSVFQDAADDAVDPHLERIKAGDDSDEEVMLLLSSYACLYFKMFKYDELLIEKKIC